MKVEPDTTRTSFCCPFCQAFTSHLWFITFGKETPENRPPMFFPKSIRETYVEDGAPEVMVKMIDLCLAGDVALNVRSSDPYVYEAFNLHLSRCFVCGRLAVWVHDKLVFPRVKLEGPDPNEDLPPDILADYQEARGIISLSPRGAAALLRLALQRLCVHLGEPGKNINNDIHNFVSKGLDANVAKAMDAVRITGNNAVHPGELDLSDDVPTVMRLFGLINFIADAMISQPKRLDAIYGGLPPSSLAAVAKRDATTPPPSPPKAAP